MERRIEDVLREQGVEVPTGRVGKKHLGRLLAKASRLSGKPVSALLGVEQAQLIVLHEPFRWRLQDVAGQRVRKRCPKTGWRVQHAAESARQGRPADPQWVVDAKRGFCSVSFPKPERVRVKRERKPAKVVAESAAAVAAMASVSAEELAGHRALTSSWVKEFKY